MPDRYDKHIDHELVKMEHSCRLVRPIFIYLKKEFGEDAVDTICSKAGLPQDYLMDEHNWMSHEFYKRILEELVDYTGDPESPFKAGLYAATPEGYGHMYWLLRAFGTPSLIYQQVVRMVPKYTKVASYEIKRLTANHMTLHLKHNAGYKPSHHTCRDAIGELASVASVWGGKPARAVEHQCQADGADVCIYELNWVNQPRTMLRIVGIAIPMLVIAADVLFGPVLLGTGAWYADWALATALIGLGYTLGWSVELRRSNAWNERLANELDRSLIESMEAVENKFSALRAAQDELAQANRELEGKNEELHYLYTRLTKAFENLKEIDAKKTEFLRIVAHDLKTPLASLRTYSKMLLMYEDLDPSDQTMFLETIEKEAVRLSHIIDRFLDLTRIEAGALTMDREPVDVHAMLTHIENVFRTTADQSGIELVSRVPKSLPAVPGDEGRLAQVVSNLISNACKFTPAGGEVSLHASVEEGERPRDRTLVVWVTDDGPGVPEELGERIYEKFFVGDKRERAGGRGLTGQGLGLYIASQIIEAHGGKLGHERRPEGGTRFYLRLPIGADVTDEAA